MVAAGFLRKNGVNVTVIEKSKFPRFIIGESLIPKCMDNFEEAGYLPALEKAGFQKKYGARFIRDGKIANFDFSKKHGEGWNWTWQVPRADFDKILTDEAEKMGVDIHFESSVLNLERKDGRWTVEIENSNSEKAIFESKFLVDSSGNGRVLANYFDLEAPPKIYDHSSVFTHIKETNRPAGPEGEQIVFEILEKEVWFWYIPFSNGVSSLGFVGRNSWFEQFSKDLNLGFTEMLEQIRFFKNRFDGEAFLFEPKMIRNVSKNVKYLHGEGWVLTGNSAEFLDPVFSSGVAFASESAVKASKLILKELHGEKADWDLEYTEHIKKGVDVFSTYVNEWYSGKLQEIFFFDNPSAQIKEQICAVLAGYVWDETNPFVKNHKRAVEKLYRFISSKNILH